MKNYKALLVFMLFISIGNCAFAGGFDNLLRQFVVSKVAEKSPEVGQLLQAVAQPRNKPRVYVAPNTQISIGQTSYGDHSPTTKMYPEPKTARDYVVYGKLLGNVGKIHEAMNYFLIARNMEPDNPEARYGLAYSLALLGHKRQARIEYEALERIRHQLKCKSKKIARLLRGN